VFVGGFARIFVRLPDGTLIQAKRQLRTASQLPEPGTEVRLGWPVSASILLPPEDAPG
jgi:hypothetical protein